MDIEVVRNYSALKFTNILDSLSILLARIMSTEKKNEVYFIH